MSHEDNKAISKETLLLLKHEKLGLIEARSVVIRKLTDLMDSLKRRGAESLPWDHKDHVNSLRDIIKEIDKILEGKDS